MGAPVVYKFEDDADILGKLDEINFAKRLGKNNNWHLRNYLYSFVFKFNGAILNAFELSIINSYFRRQWYKSQRLGIRLHHKN